MHFIKYRNRIILLFALLAFILGFLMQGEIYTPSLYAIYIVLFSLIAFSIVQKQSFLSRGFIFKLMIFSLVVKIGAVYVMEYLQIKQIGMPFLSYKDDYVYDESSTDILNAWRVRGFGFYDDVRFGTGFYAGYPVFSAFAKYLFGDNHLVPRYMNVFFSTLTIPFFYATLKYYTTKINARTISLLFAFSSLFVVYSALQLKDIILIFFLATLIYSNVKMLKEGFSFKVLGLIALSMLMLLFYRAAILLPYIVAVITSYVVSRSSVKTNRFTMFMGVLGVLSLFFFIWNYMYDIGLLGLTGEEYFEGRLSSRGTESSYSGSNDLSKLGIVGVIVGPLLLLLSLFLPTPGLVKLDMMSNSINYHYLPLIEYYGILPMVIISIFFIIKNYRYQRIGIFILIFLLLYKIGQAGGKSIFDSRQSLPAIYMSYLLLGFFDIKNKKIETLWHKYKWIIIVIMIIVMFSFTYSRMLLRM